MTGRDGTTQPSRSALAEGSAGTVPTAAGLLSVLAEQVRPVGALPGCGALASPGSSGTPGHKGPRDFPDGVAAADPTPSGR